MSFCISCGAKTADGSEFCINGALRLQPQSAAGSGYSLRINSPEVMRFKKKRKNSAIVFFCIFAVGLLAFLAIYSAVTKQIPIADVLLIYAAVMAVTGLLTLITHKAGRAAFDGVVADKRIVKSVRRHDDGDNYWDETVYTPTLYIRKTDGRTKAVELPDKNLFDYFTTGERVRKHSGFSYPEKFIKPPALTHCLNCGALFASQAESCPKCRMPAIK